MAVFSTRSGPLPPTSSLASGMSARLGRMRLASGISSMGRLPILPAHPRHGEFVFRLFLEVGQLDGSDAFFQKDGGALFRRAVQSVVVNNGFSADVQAASVTGLEGEGVGPRLGDDQEAFIFKGESSFPGSAQGRVKSMGDAGPQRLGEVQFRQFGPSVLVFQVFVFQSAGQVFFAGQPFEGSFRSGLGEFQGFLLVKDVRDGEPDEALGDVPGSATALVRTCGICSSTV